MEDDEEIMSHPSGGSGSPSPPPPRHSGRITVTVAAPPPQNSLTLALPIQQPRQIAGTGNISGGGGGGREDCWSEGATAVLIEAWGERYLELSRGNLKQKHWKEVADIVSSRDDYIKPPKTDIQCKNRIDTVKKKYKTEKQRIAVSGAPSRWPFFEKLDELIGPSAKFSAAVTSVSPAPPSVSPAGYSRAMDVPMGIPVGIRPMPISQFRQPQPLNLPQIPNPNSNPRRQLKRKAPVDIDSDDSEPEPPSRDSSDGFPPDTYGRRRQRIERESMNASGLRFGMNKGRSGNGGNGNGNGGGKEQSWGSSVRELTAAILKLGEAYQQAETSKLQQLVEMEKQRMKFAKEMELQKMQFFMNTQMQISQLKLKYRRVGNSIHHSNTNNQINDNNNSDCSS